MIFGNINQLEEFPYLEEAVKSALNMQKITIFFLMKKDVTRLTETGCL